MPIWRLMTSKISRINLSDLINLVLLTVFTYFLSVGRQLKPIADDYCNWSVSNNGPFDAALRMWKNWDGGFVNTYLNSLLVGMPLRLFGFKNGS